MQRRPFRPVDGPPETPPPFNPDPALFSVRGVMRRKGGGGRDQPGVVEEDCFEEQEFSMRLINSIHAYRTLRPQTHWSSEPEDHGWCASDGREEDLGYLL